jgi:hypothetical protein
LNRLGRGARRKREGDDPGVDTILENIERRVITYKPMTPEQGCLGCGLSIALVFASLLVWLFLYWYYNPEFHAQAHRLPSIMGAYPTPRPKMP